jgi:hypothetical protein
MRRHVSKDPLGVRQYLSSVYIYIYYFPRKTEFMILSSSMIFRLLVFLFCLFDMKCNQYLLTQWSLTAFIKRLTISTFDIFIPLDIYFFFLQSL